MNEEHMFQLRNKKIVFSYAQLSGGLECNGSVGSAETGNCHLRHCVVPLSKTLNLQLSTG